MSTITQPTIGDAVIVATTDDMDRPTWLEHRRAGIGGSDAAAICGLNRYTSEFEVWLDKVDVPTVDADEDSEPAHWGRILEPIVAEEVARREGVELVEVKAILAHPDRPWQLANIDRAAYLAGELGIYEGKTAGYFMGADWDDDAVPESYLVQGMHYLAVTNLPWLLYGVLIGGQRLAIRRVDRDQELIDHLIQLEATFWQRVVDRNPPEPDGSKAATEFIGHLFDVKAGLAIELDEAEVLPLLYEREEARLDVKAAEERMNAASNKLKLRIGEAETVRSTTDGRVLYTCKQFPAVEVKATTRSAYRRLHIPAGVLQ